MIQLLFVVIQSEMLEKGLHKSDSYKLAEKRGVYLGQDFNEVEKAKDHPTIEELKKELTSCICYLESNGIKSAAKKGIEAI